MLLTGLRALLEPASFRSKLHGQRTAFAGHCVLKNIEDNQTESYNKERRGRKWKDIRNKKRLSARENG